MYDWAFIGVLSLQNLEGKFVFLPSGGLVATNWMPLPSRVKRTVSHNSVVYITRSGARFARPLLACAWISFVYLLHGRLLCAWCISPTL